LKGVKVMTFRTGKREGGPRRIYPKRFKFSLVLTKMEVGVKPWGGEPQGE